MEIYIPECFKDEIDAISEKRKLESEMLSKQLRQIINYLYRFNKEMILLHTQIRQQRDEFIKSLKSC